MVSEAGHHASRVYIGQDGALYINGGAVYNSDGNDIAAQLDVLDTLVAAELTFVDGALEGTVVASKVVVADSSKDVGNFGDLGTTSVSLVGATNDAKIVAADQANQENTYTVPDIDADASFVMTAGAQSIAGAKTLTDASTGTGSVVLRAGGTATEGAELRVYDETVSPAAVETNLINLPAGAMVVAVQANVETALTGGGTTVTWSVGTAGDPDKYGTAGFPTAGDDLTQNAKSDWMGNGTQLTAAEQMVLTGAATGGASDGDTALTVGSVRVRVVYWFPNSLDNA